MSVKGSNGRNRLEALAAKPWLLSGNSGLDLYEHLKHEH